jgi:hypothetical protein
MIKVKLDKGYIYKSRKEYADDVRLVFNNAMSYNQQGHWVHDVAKALLAHFEQRLKSPVSRSGRPLSTSPRDSALESSIASLLERTGVTSAGQGGRKRKSAGFPAAQTVLMQEDPVGESAPPPSDTLAAVWYSMLQNTATFLVGSKDEHIIPALHWHCSVCRTPIEGKAWIVRRPPIEQKPPPPGGTIALKPVEPPETVPPCMALCYDCHGTDEAQDVFADVEPHKIEQVDLELADTTDPDPIMPPNEFVDVRNTFFESCQEGNYNFDTLRRAKHSTMMVLHRLHGLHPQKKKEKETERRGRRASGSH